MFPHIDYNPILDPLSSMMEALISAMSEYTAKGGGVCISLRTPFRTNPRRLVYIVLGRSRGVDVLGAGMRVPKIREIAKLPPFAKHTLRAPCRWIWELFCSTLGFRGTQKAYFE